MMTESLMTHSDTRNMLRLGLVTDLSGNRIEVVLDGEIFQAVRSFGCVVDPRTGDRVVVFLPDGHAPVILSIIDSGQTGDSPSRTMRFAEGLSLEVSGRPFALRAHEGIEIDSPRDTRIVGRGFVGQFSTFELGADTLTLSGGVLSFVGQKIGQIAKTLERVAEWILDRAHGSNREIDTVDRHRSGETLIESESIVSIQSRTTLLSSQDLVKVDSDQIHLG